MIISDIYRLGEMVEIKAVNHGQTTSVLIYTKGRKLAQTLLSKGNVSMPKEHIYKIAGVKKVTDEAEIQACCYAKAIYDEIQKAKSNSKPNETIYAVNIAREFTHKLKKRPKYLLATAQDHRDKTAELVIMGAKNFVSLPIDRQNEIMDSLTHSNQAQA